MPRSLVMDQLSSKARDQLKKYLGNKVPVPLIAQKIEAEFGTTLHTRTIWRYKEKLEKVEKRIAARCEEVRAIARAMEAGDITAPQMLEALAIDAAMTGVVELQSSDPIKLQNVGMVAAKVRIQEKSLDLKRRQIELDEKKFQAVQAREQRTLDALKSGDETKTSPEEMLRKVKEIYGLKHDN